MKLREEFAKLDTMTTDELRLELNKTIENICKLSEETDDIHRDNQRNIDTLLSEIEKL